MSIFDEKSNYFISHRGFQAVAPENSLPSFYYAGLLGQWAIETDVHMTKDGVLVCCHNYTIDSTFDGVGAIKDMTYDELNKFSIIKGNRVDCFSKNDLRIPKFLEYLAICKKFSAVPFIELKTDDVKPVLDCCRENGFNDDEIVISSVDFNRLKETRKYSKDVFIHWIFAEEDRLKEFAELKNAGISFKIADSFTCPKEKIDDAHKLGLKVCLRACDDLRTYEHMKELGLDYFPSNYMHEDKLK